MLHTPLYQYHLDHGGQMVDYAGWEMPIRYTSIHEEHKQVRKAAGLFDVSHMGRIKFTGVGARRLLERVLTRRISDMDVQRCRYGLICNESGGVLDDVITYRFDDHWMLVVNAANRQKILDHLQANTDDLKVNIEDLTQNTAMVAVQGPKVIDMIGQFAEQVLSLKRYAFCLVELMGMILIVSRTGYTGEDGVEIIMPAGGVGMSLDLLETEAAKNEDLQLKPAGLGARDSLRLEAGMPLYGHELDEQTDPLSAGLGFAVSLDKGQETSGPKIPTFIGQEALQAIAADDATAAKAIAPKRKLIGLALEGRRTPRQGMNIASDSEGTILGQVTSGCLSPTLDKPIAMAYVPANSLATGDSVAVQLGSKWINAQVVDLPFYKRPAS